MNQNNKKIHGRKNGDERKREQRKSEIEENKATKIKTYSHSVNDDLINKYGLKIKINLK
jgi:hypothetical protein